MNLVHKTTRILLSSTSIRSSLRSNNLFCAFHHKSIYPISGKMSSLFIRNLDDDERMQINLDLKVGDSMKTFNLNRMKNEELGHALDRLRASLAKKTKKKNKKKKKSKDSDEQSKEGEEAEEDDSIPLEVLHNREPIPLSVVNDKAWISGAVLRFGEEEISATYNPPSVNLDNLCPTIMVGYPLFPSAEFEFCNSNSCEFHWKSIEKKLVDAVKRNASSGVFDFSDTLINYSYTPLEKDINKHIVLICVPKTGSGDKTGKIQLVVSEAAVEAGPDQCPFEKRQMSTQHRSKSGEFRVISYNILAEVYTSTELAKNFLFAHLPKYALDMSYRKQLLSKEISGYQADVVCLQEVDKSVFFKHLTPALHLEGFDGFYTPKKGGSSEGCATFIRKDKFKVVNTLDIVLSDYLATDESCQDLWDKICQKEALKEKVEQRSSILQVTVTESLERPGQFTCVANTHLYFHPDACNIRLIHAATALRYLQAVCAAYTQEGKAIGFVLCGDFNSSPDVGVYQLMTTGFVQSDRVDWVSGGEKEALSDVELSHPLNIVSACGTPDFTHYGAPLQCTLDYIFVETSRLEVVSTVPMIDLADVQTHTFLPNPLIPSDHLALVSDLKFKT